MQKIDYLQEKINNILNELTNVFNEINNIKAKKIEQCETIYDKNSEDENINWNLKDGLMGAGSKSGQDFSKYKALRLHILFGNKVNHIAEISLENPTPNSTRKEYWSSIKVGDENGTVNFYFAIFKVTNKTTFANIGMGFFSGSTKTVRNAHSSYYVYKIEGIY